jgi:membrane protein CcdC involved in cytochrome C biogenesis
MDKMLSCVGVLVLIVLALTINVLLDGFALATLWGWFVVPVFHVPSLSVIQAIGFGLVMTVLTKQFNESKSEKQSSTEAITRIFTYAVGIPLFYLCFGWVIHLFM